MALKFHEPEFHGLLMVISGGQCGADRGGLEAAAEIGVITGGVAPLGWRTCRGPQPELARFDLIEDTDSGYQSRTRANIDAADGTIIIVSNPSSPGSRYTASYARKVAKPTITLQIYSDDGKDMLVSHGRTLSAWIEDYRITVLNVAGNRDHYGSNFHHWASHGIVSTALLDLQTRGFLHSSIL